MKKILLSVAVVINLLLLQACNVNDPNHHDNFDNTPPAPPSGIQVINGDNRVDLSWTRNRENDLAGYNIYYSASYDGKYYLLGSSSSNSYIDNGATNGVLNYYAVTAYDQSGNESDLSKDVVYATPRPEGFNQSVFDYLKFPGSAGYSFSNYSVVAYNDSLTDFFFENYNGKYYLDVYTDTDILDAGPTSDIYDIPFAPASGWSPTKDTTAVIGHTYVIWTWSNHYAKIRVSNITSERIVFDWAYQLVPGNTQLKPLPGRTIGTTKRNLVRMLVR
ncbi:MAG: hypothetical protein P4L27_04895 [Ignavibacteriaceae bacterium]|nr:hypothetical protein [Ignavibacteriaceae bacterium]